MVRVIHTRPHPHDRARDAVCVVLFGLGAGTEELLFLRGRRQHAHVGRREEVCRETLP